MTPATRLSVHLCRLHTRADRINLLIGKTLSWLTLVMVILVTGIVLARLLLDKGSIAVQESITYSHATLFMLCLAFNLQQNSHVRVDVFYHRFSPVTRAWVNTLGAIVFLIPFAVFLTFISMEFVDRAWDIRETSVDPGGLPFIYLLKTVIPAAGLLLLVQALSQILGNLAVILEGSEA